MEERLIPFLSTPVLPELSSRVYGGRHSSSETFRRPKTISTRYLPTTSVLPPVSSSPTINDSRRYACARLVGGVLRDIIMAYKRESKRDDSDVRWTARGGGGDAYVNEERMSA